MQRNLRICDLGRIDYSEALSLQTKVHSARANGTIPDTLFLLEHPHVFTMGLKANTANLLEPEDTLRQAGISLEKTSRGGDITYHGPGQLVGYPIINIKSANQSVLSFITAIESIIIDVLAGYGINAGRDPRNRGVWVENNKIAAIGLKISRQVSMHGFALNVSTNLDYYKKIIPCGLNDAGVTSINSLAPRVDMQSVKQNIAMEFQKHLMYECINYVQPNEIEKAELD